MDGTESMITEQPDPEKPWGIGCVVCSRYHAWLSSKTKTAVPLSAWASFSVGSGRKNLGIFDLLQHVGRAGDTKPPNKFHAEAMENRNLWAADSDTEPLVQPNIGLDERDDVPSLSQMRICYDIVKRVTPPLGKTYEVECTRAREAGDAAASVRRGGQHTPPKIARSIAVALFEQDRQLLSKGKIAALGIAQDMRKRT